MGEWVPCWGRGHLGVHLVSKALETENVGSS